MVHVPALPGTPANTLSIQEIIKQSCAEAKLLEECGLDAIMIENMHDVPYLNTNVGPEITAGMTAVAISIRQQCKLPLGIQILAAANIEALAVAQAANLNFIRAEGFVYAHVADEGYIESCAGELLRYRKMIGAENVKIFTDVRKKHSSHSITNDISLEEQIKTSQYFRSDGIIITGRSTGEEALPDEVQTARKVTSLPVIVGSGVDVRNIEKYWHWADMFIVGSSLKENGQWQNPLSEIRIKEFMNQVKYLRNL